MLTYVLDVEKTILNNFCDYFHFKIKTKSYVLKVNIIWVMRQYCCAEVVLF